MSNEQRYTHLATWYGERQTKVAFAYLNGDRICVRHRIYDKQSPPWSAPWTVTSFVESFDVTSFLKTLFDGCEGAKIRVYSPPVDKRTIMLSMANHLRSELSKLISRVNDL